LRWRGVGWLSGTLENSHHKSRSAQRLGNRNRDPRSRFGVEEIGSRSCDLFPRPRAGSETDPGPRHPGVHFVCHDATAWHDDPLIFPRVLRYVAVDHRCQKRFEETPQIPRENIRVLFNAVDLSRFKPRPLLPDKPRRAAIFSNYATKETHTNPVTRACKRLGIALDVIGKGFNTSTFKPEEVLPAYDIVFAKARCALEAMAVGSAVVLCDFPGLGAMVDCANFTQLRKLNFGAGALVHPLDPELIAAEINKYDAHEAHRVSQRARAEACLSGAAVEWLELYNEVIAENALLNQRRDENRQSEECCRLSDCLPPRPEYLLRSQNRRCCQKGRYWIAVPSSRSGLAPPYCFQSACCSRDSPRRRHPRSLPLRCFAQSRNDLRSLFRTRRRRRWSRPRLRHRAKTHSPCPR
jgi:hypothetical protein